VWQQWWQCSWATQTGPIGVSCPDVLYVVVVGDGLEGGLSREFTGLVATIQVILNFG
jgi:hypothetical protein